MTSKTTNSSQQIELEGIEALKELALIYSGPGIIVPMRSGNNSIRNYGLSRITLGWSCKPSLKISLS